MNHLIDIKTLSQDDMEKLFEQADHFKQSNVLATKKLHAGRSAMALFFENSTRTLTSFQLACQRLGIDLTALNISHSSTQKGESIRDTIETLNAMQTDAFIIRHHENHVHSKVIEWVGDKTSVINAGDGSHQHPTQGLLDLYTIRQHKNDFSQIKVTVIGDIKHSRVANSLLDGLTTMGTTEVNLYAPENLIPNAAMHLRASSMQAALEDADVVVMLRIQKERFTSSEAVVDFNDWHQHYGLNQERLKWAKSDAIVMHPGPMNRGVEISAAVADGSQSVVLQQVTNGVLIRQALIHQLLQ